MVLLGGRSLRGVNRTQYTTTLGEVEGKFFWESCRALGFIVDRDVPEVRVYFLGRSPLEHEREG